MRDNEIVSLTGASFQRVCSLYFPTKFPMGVSAKAAQNETAFNTKFGGWNLKTSNVFYANGKSE